MIEVKNLSKQFKAPSDEKGLFGPKKKAFWAVKDLNFDIRKGSVASILGPNGCGKTTTLRMIAGMLTPSKGTAFVDSVDVRKDKQTVKSKIGYIKGSIYYQEKEIYTSNGKTVEIPSDSESQLFFATYPRYENYSIRELEKALKR